MDNNYLVVGYRKGSKDNSIHNFSAHLYGNEKALRKMFSWVDGPDGNNMRHGGTKLTLDDIIKQTNRFGTFRCENDVFCFIFKVNPLSDVID